MKTILLIAGLILCAVSNTSCELGQAQDSPEGPPLPSPLQVLEDRLGDERQLRIEAEESAAGETVMRERWQVAATALAILAIVAFLAGTSIGSRGRRYAEPA